MTSDILLTPSEVAFVDEYLRTGDAALAAHVCGVRYERKPTDMRPPHMIGAEMLERDNIKRAISGRDVGVLGVTLTKDVLSADAYEIKEKALVEGRYSEAINALKLVGDFEGLRAQKVDINIKKDATLLTDEELIRIASGGRLLDVTPEKVEE
jgi:hypothetical protein